MSMGKHFFLMVTIGLVWSFEAKVVRTVAVSLVEEHVNGHLFVHRIDVVDGLKKEKWTLDNKAIEPEAYDQRILEAEMQERKIERQKEYEKRVRLAEFKQEARSQVTKQLLAHMIDQVEQGLSKFEKYELKPYLVYSPGTIANEVDFSDITTYQVSPARNLLVCDFEIEKAQETIEKLEPYVDKLAVLFEESVTNAINKCDEPKKLKQWLEMLS